MSETKKGGYIIDDGEVGPDYDFLKRLERLLRAGKLDEADQLIEETFPDEDE